MEKKSYIVRLKMDKGANCFDDLLHGKVLVVEREGRCRFDGPVVLKSEDYPTYHLANVLDNHLMGITHVSRKGEKLPSTLKHLALYETYGCSLPKYIHITSLSNLTNAKKLGKRHDNWSVLGFKNQEFYLKH